MKKFLDYSARLISQLFQPPLIIGVFLLFLVFYFAPDANKGIIWASIAVGLVGLAPTIYTIIAYKLHWVKDLWLNDKADRIGPFLIAGLGMIITLLIFFKLGVPIEVQVFLMALILVLLFLLFITIFWKISVHAATIMMVVTTINILADCKFWYLFALVPLVMWARVYRKRHSVAQVCAGAILSGVIVYATFKIFGF